MYLRLRWPYSWISCPKPSVYIDQCTLNQSLIYLLPTRSWQATTLFFTKDNSKCAQWWHSWNSSSPDDSINKANFLDLGANRLYTILNSVTYFFHDCGQVPYIFSFSDSFLYTMVMIPIPLQEMAEKRKRVPSVGEFPRKNSVFSIPKWTHRSKHSNFTQHRPWEDKDRLKG